MPALDKVDPWWKTTSWGRTYIAKEVVVALIVASIITNGISAAVAYNSAPVKTVVKEVKVETQKECVNATDFNEVDSIQQGADLNTQNYTVPPIGNIRN